ncbi:MAG: heparinase II/III family protein, partial [Fimbriimonadaceae bacterium]
MLSRRILLIRTLLRLGPRALWLNLKHRLRLKFGVYEKTTPACDWRDEVPEFVSIFELPSIKTLESAVIADVPYRQIAYFSGEELPMPTNWQLNPKTNYDYSDDETLRHWSRIPMSAGGDIKWAWEASRMDWVISAGLAILSTPPSNSTSETLRSDLIAEILVWKAANPPNQGVNWACGQETSFRMFALLWLASILDPEERDLITKLLPQHAERIEGAVEYAISQHNNHGLSETVALFLAGHTLPSHPRAKIWREKGKRLFIKQVREQFTRDGWYCQHSHNYTRVALLDAVIAMRVARQFEDPLPEDVIDRFRMAAKLLAGICRDGKVPNYGAND